MTAQNEQNAWQDYLKILNSGVFYECHPDLTGCWEIDKEKFIKFLSRNRPQARITTEQLCAITPAHYGGQDNTYEAIKVIEAWGLNFSLGNVIKYISRAGKKENTTALQDLLKAKKYLEFEIAKHEALHS